MIERIAGTDLTGLKACILARRPCILTQLPEELQCLHELADFETLNAAADSVEVSAEPISADGRYGTGAAKQKLTFRALLKALQQGKQLYLTSQYGKDEEAILTEPLFSLKQTIRFPVSPKSAQGLVVSKINLWLGASKEGRSSGCHHDFHDNFYCLLSGSKTFRLFPPTNEMAERLNLQGQVVQRFDNGLVAYDECLCSDGMTQVAKAQITVDLREAQFAACRNAGMPYEEAEELFEEAVEHLLFCSVTAGVEEDDLEADTDDDNEIDQDSDSDREDGEFDADQDDSSSSGHEGSTAQGSFDNPPSFSTLRSEQVSALVDKYGETICLSRGEMLYLPASWFHEVISHSGAEDFHMAVNYWFYPPDDNKGGYKDTEVMQEMQRRTEQIYPSIQGVKKHKTDNFNAESDAYDACA
jgi:hypothetical protein